MKLVNFAGDKACARYVASCKSLKAWAKKNKKVMKTLDKAAVALRYYEALRANIVQGWEKYILTDGKMCMFVNRTYQPGPGEAVFYLTTRSRQTMCQLISVNAEEMYTIEAQDGLKWIVRDTIHDVTIVFTEGMFSSTKKITPPSRLTEVEGKCFPRWVSEIEDWVEKSHSDKATCNLEARRGACKKLDRKEYWIVVAGGLNGILHEGTISADVALQAEIDDYIEYEKPVVDGVGVDADEVRRAVHSLTADEAKEVIDMAKMFWESERDAEEWAAAAAAFAAEKGGDEEEG